METSLRNYKASTLIVLIVLLVSIFVIVDFNLLIFNKPLALFSVVTFISTVLFIIDKYLWFHPPFSWFLKMPKIKGRYTGKLTSSYLDKETNKATTKEVVLEITQTFSSISVVMYFSNNGTAGLSSHSVSVLESIEFEKEGCFIHFTFFNEPNLPSQLVKHYGTCKLKYVPSELRLIGSYYNDRGNNGSIEVKFESIKLKGQY